MSQLVYNLIEQIANQTRVQDPVSLFSTITMRKEPGNIKLLPEIWGLLPSECVVNLAVSVVYISGGKNPRERASVPGCSVLLAHEAVKGGSCAPGAVSKSK